MHSVPNATSTPNPKHSWAKTAASINAIPELNEAVAFHWFKFPSLIAERLSKFDGASLKVYLVLLQHADKTGKCWPSRPRIQSMTGLSRASITRAIKTLRSMKLLNTKYSKRNTTIYYLRDFTSPPKETCHQ